ncbi:MAG: SUMF1/EgtB/PvdO family nonheme iron enzyme, partial [Pedosphaera parvula]|nr:SUMF1/EgtB/PvdO family nonheme iron enzyme [Pedosphaera parvula]
ERPLRRVFVPAFYIDRYEVTNRQFQQFKRDHEFEAGEEDLPVTFVFKHEAEACCRSVGKRLPTNAEWEKAARGTDGRTYPWGDEFKAGYSNLQERHTAGQRKLPGGSFPKGVSPYGCHDLCGNVWEWVSDVHTDTSWFGGRSDSNPCGIIRGGAHSYSSFQGRTSYQGLEALNATCHDVGFRCAMDAIPKRA